MCGADIPNSRHDDTRFPQFHSTNAQLCDDQDTDAPNSNWLSQGCRNIWGTRGGLSPPSFNRISNFALNHSYDPNIFVTVLLNFRVGPQQIFRSSYAPVQNRTVTGRELRNKNRSHLVCASLSAQLPSLAFAYAQYRVFRIRSSKSSLSRNQLLLPI